MLSDSTFSSGDPEPGPGRHVWRQVSARVKFLQYIGIYWVGHPDESEEAHAHLVQWTGQELTSPALYLKWYRKTYLGLAH